MLVHRRERGEAETAADFLQARRVAVLLDEIVEEIENFPLTFGQWQHGADYTQRKSESQRLAPFNFRFPPRSNRV